MFRVLSGTSMASPHVAGVAALILQQNPTFTPAQVRDEILKFALKDVVNNGSYSQSPNFLLQVPKYSKHRLP
jgi:serine protease